MLYIKKKPSMYLEGFDFIWYVCLLIVLNQLCHDQYTYVDR